jgi:competence CoiA-like predicted nuclease
MFRFDSGSGAHVQQLLASCKPPCFMQKFKVFISGNFRVSVIVEAESADAAERAIAEDFDLSTIEELILSHGLKPENITDINAFPADTGRYIAKSHGELYHRYFESRENLLLYLRELADEKYGKHQIPDDNLYDFFRVHDYFRPI